MEGVGRYKKTKVGVAKIKTHVAKTKVDVKKKQTGNCTTSRTKIEK